jgi:hypothetical protein
MAKMEMKPEMEFEQRVDRRFRLLEANLGLLTNYIKWIAKSFLKPEKIRELENDYERERGEIESD